MEFVCREIKADVGWRCLKCEKVVPLDQKHKELHRCMACHHAYHNAYMKRRWRKDPKKSRAERRKHEMARHLRNPTANAERLRKRRREKPEQVAAERRRWVEKNWDQYLVLAKRGYVKRVIRELTQTVKEVTAQDIAWRRAMWGGRCAYCAALATEMDHTIPLGRGGPHCPANLRPVCRRCNASKGKKTLSEWFAIRKLDNK